MSDSKAAARRPDGPAPAAAGEATQLGRPGGSGRHAAPSNGPRLRRSRRAVTCSSAQAVRLLFVFSLALTRPALSEERRIPFWPDAVPAAIRAHVDGAAALETVRELSRFHRVHGSPGFAAAAEHLRAKLAAAGLSNVSVERLPADGVTHYAHFRSYLGWTASTATLEETGAVPRLLARFPESPVALADYSQDADVSAELIDVGSGADVASYAGKDVRGKIVLASGPLATVHRRACEELGALGFVSDFPNQRTAWSSDDRDLVRWGHLSPYQRKNTFAFMVSKRESEDLRRRLGRGERITLRARVKARMVPASFDLVTALVRGTDATAGDVLLTAHLCHQSAGANDNASGSAAIFEVARALQAAVASGALPAPRRSIRFLWAPEIAGSLAWVVKHREDARRIVGGIHMDMVGGLLATTRGTFHLSRTAATLPHVLNDIGAAWFDDVVRRSARHAERGADAYDGLVFPPGSREAFLGDIRELELGSDHEVFEEVSFGIPMLYFHDWPDVTIHTNKDQPENLDATKLGRVAYMGAGIAWTLAALPDAEAPKLLAVARASGEALQAAARLRAFLASDAQDGTLFVREAEATHAATLQSMDRLWKLPAGAMPPPVSRRDQPAPAGRDGRVPVRSPNVQGPLGVYYYDHLSEVLGPDVETDTALTRREGGDLLSYEALNLVDGRRSVAAIRDVLTGLYRPVPVAELSEYFDLLARARVVTWK